MVSHGYQEEASTSAGATRRVWSTVRSRRASTARFPRGVLREESSHGEPWISRGGLNVCGCNAASLLNSEIQTSINC